MGPRGQACGLLVCFILFHANFTSLSLSLCLLLFLSPFLFYSHSVSLSAVCLSFSLALSLLLSPSPLCPSVLQLLEAQADYHRKSLTVLENVLPTIQAQQGTVCTNARTRVHANAHTQTQTYVLTHSHTPLYVATTAMVPFLGNGSTTLYKTFPPGPLLCSKPVGQYVQGLYQLACKSPVSHICTHIQTHTYTHTLTLAHTNACTQRARKGFNGVAMIAGRIICWCVSVCLCVCVLGVWGLLHFGVSVVWLGR